MKTILRQTLHSLYNQTFYIQDSVCRGNFSVSVQHMISSGSVYDHRDVKLMLIGRLFRSYAVLAPLSRVQVMNRFRGEAERSQTSELNTDISVAQKPPESFFTPVSKQTDSFC